MIDTKPARTAGRIRVGDAGRTLFGPPNGNPSPATVALVRRGKTDAAHLAACWNLVEDFGGDPEAVRRALEALQSIARRVVRASHPSQAQEPLVRDARAALDALGRK